MVESVRCVCNWNDGRHLLCGVQTILHTVVVGIRAGDVSEHLRCMLPSRNARRQTGCCFAVVFCSRSCASAATMIRADHDVDVRKRALLLGAIVMMR